MYLNNYVYATCQTLPSGSPIPIDYIALHHYPTHQLIGKRFQSYDPVANMCISLRLNS